MGARFFAPVQTGPGAHPASCTMGTGSFREVKSGRDMTLTAHPLFMPWSRKSRAVPLLPLWAVRPGQSLSACTMVHFTLPLPFTHLAFSTHALRTLSVRLRSVGYEEHFAFCLYLCFPSCDFLKIHTSHFPRMR
jgi:hypothetical protein